MFALVLAFLASLLSTSGLQHYLVKRGAVDVPNNRSSHSVPVPRGGGISVVVVFLLAIFWLARSHVFFNSLAWVLTGGGAIIGAVGLIDDHFHLPVWPRLVIHFVVAGWTLWRLGALSPLHLERTSSVWPNLSQILSLISLVWLINLYNFMDGIDGLAAMEAVCTAGFGGVLLQLGGLGGYAESAWMLAASSGGFLVWNWPPAKIFLGDAGSGFLGFVLGVLAISSARTQTALFWPWLILLSAFIVDSTVTLMRRLITGARWYEAHCSHAYQQAARRLGSHTKVTLTVALINIAWLIPLAWAAYIHPSVGPLLGMIAIAPLIGAAIKLNAGLTEASPAA